jgi:hypothetical protein
MELGFHFEIGSQLTSTHIPVSGLMVVLLIIPPWHAWWAIGLVIID